MKYVSPWENIKKKTKNKKKTTRLKKFENQRMREASTA